MADQRSKRMRTRFVIAGALLSLLACFPLAAPDVPKLVNNVEGLIDKIGSDRSLNLSEGTYNLAAVAGKVNNVNVTWEKLSGGYQLVIHDVSNLSISGIDKESIKIVTEAGAVNTINFVRSKGIKLKNLEVGHAATARDVIGSALSFEDCESITISDCILAGSGQGLNLLRTKGLDFKRSKITGCGNGIMTLSKSNATITNATFKNNKGDKLIDISDGSNVTVTDSEICDNSGKTSNPNTAMFSIDAGSSVKIGGTTISRNKIAVLPIRGMRPDIAPSCALSDNEEYYDLSGKASLADGKGIPDVVISFNNGQFDQVRTDAIGNWFKTELRGTVTVAASKPGFTFAKNSQVISVKDPNANFIGTDNRYSLSGSVHFEDGTVIPDAEISFIGDGSFPEVYSSTNGNWVTKKVLYGTVTVRVKRKGCEFSEDRKVVSLSTADEWINFMDKRPAYSVAGRVFQGGNIPLAGVEIVTDSDLLGKAVTDNRGKWKIEGLHGPVRLRARASNAMFLPEYIDVTQENLVVTFILVEQ